MSLAGETGTLTNYPVPALVFNSVHAAPRKTFSLVLMGLRRLARTARSRPRYSEIEKELLARREAARFGATSGAYTPRGGNLKPGHAVQRS
jgi:hypothetical protein